MKNKLNDNKIVMDFIAAVCPEAPELYAASFNEIKCLKDATGLIDQLRARNAELEAEVARLRKALAESLEASARCAIHSNKLSMGIAAVRNLINESQGVAGLHLNGDLALWCELRTGGQFEGWLLDFDKVLEASDG